MELKRLVSGHREGLLFHRSVTFQTMGAWTLISKALMAYTQKFQSLADAAMCRVQGVLPEHVDGLDLPRFHGRFRGSLMKNTLSTRNAFFCWA